MKTLKTILLATLMMILTGITTADSGTTTIEVDCWHNTSCIICGEDDYQCSSWPGWQPNCTFNNPTPAGHKITKIEATAYGTGCTDYNSTLFTILLNNEAIETETMPGTCQCECDPTTATSTYYENGFPGYLYNETNTLTIDTPIGNYICLAYVNLTLYYEPKIPDSTTPTVPEFTTPLIAIIILLTSPAFAYLLVKRK